MNQAAVTLNLIEHKKICAGYLWVNGALRRCIRVNDWIRRSFQRLTHPTAMG
jgi:hypothetical protein